MEGLLLGLSLLPKATELGYSPAPPGLVPPPWSHRRLYPISALEEAIEGRVELKVRSLGFRSWLCHLLAVP